MAFSLADLPNVVVMVVIAAIVIGVGATVTSDLSADLTDTTAQAAADNGTEAMANIGAKLPILGTIAVLSVILGLVFTALVFKN
ncbi:MAG: hypothetical protein CL811_12375 [Colwelliaceae bacterium]|jgi:hypothetical protein|nr:hypothetical protein [Colwelliaceae bacterium]